MAVEVEEGLDGEVVVAVGLLVSRGIGVGCSFVSSSSHSVIHQGIRHITSVILYAKSKHLLLAGERNVQVSVEIIDQDVSA